MLALLVSIIRRVTGNAASTPTLVLSKFDVDARTGRVNIKGRPGGILDWIMTAIGIQTTTVLSVSPQEVRLTSSSLFGEVETFSAVPNISSVTCRLRKPFGFLLFAIFPLLLAIAGLFNSDFNIAFFGTIIAGLFIVAYILLKSIEIRIEASGGSFVSVRFKRSVIENIPMDMARAREAVEIISRVVMMAHQNEHQLPKKQPIPEPITGTHHCTQCGSAINRGESASFCQSCGAKI